MNAEPTGQDDKSSSVPILTDQTVSNGCRHTNVETDDDWLCLDCVAEVPLRFSPKEVWEAFWRGE